MPSDVAITWILKFPGEIPERETESVEAVEPRLIFVVKPSAPFCDAVSQIARFCTNKDGSDSMFTESV